MNTSSKPAGATPGATGDTVDGKVHPAPIEVIQARKEAGLNQTQAGAVVYSSLRAWQQWEAGDRPMHPALWELFGLKTGSLVLKRMRRKASTVLHDGADAPRNSGPTSDAMQM